MRMETASTLVLRKALNPANPVHRAIIEESETSSGDEAEKASVDDCVVVAPAARAIGSRFRGIKRKIKAETSRSQNKAVKSEQLEVLTGSRSKAQTDVIDLT